jgi:hypothetical protein
MDIEEKFVAIIIIGHGGIITIKNVSNISQQSNLSLGLPKEFRNIHKKTKKIRWLHEETEKRMQPREMRIMPQIINSNTNLSICTFAVPTESCSYPEDTLINLKNELIYRLRQETQMNDEIFKNILYVGQRRGREPFTYSSDVWAPYFTKRPQYTERWIYGKKYINKLYTDAPESPIDCGVYVLQNNVGIQNGVYLSYSQDGTELKELIEYFEEEYDVNKIYMLDTTCSNVYNPEMNNFITDTNIIDNVFKYGVSLMSAGKRHKRKKHKTNKNKKKNKNKRKKYKTKKK